jgi:hypothetical protein
MSLETSEVVTIVTDGLKQIGAQHRKSLETTLRTEGALEFGERILDQIRLCAASKAQAAAEPAPEAAPEAASEPPAQSDFQPPQPADEAVA